LFRKYDKEFNFYNILLLFSLREIMEYMDVVKFQIVCLGINIQ